VAGEQFAKFVKVADIPMDRKKLAMYFNTITYNNNQINRTYTNNFVYFKQSFNDWAEHYSVYYISTDNTIIANGKQDRQYRIDNQYFRQSNSIVEYYNEFGFFDNPAVTNIPEFESTFHIQEINANKVFDMYLTNEVNYIKQDVIEFWKSTRPNFVDEFPIVTIDYQPYIYLKNGEAIPEYQAVGYYQDYFVTYDSLDYAKFIRLSDMETFYLSVADDIYNLLSIYMDFFYMFIYNNELYCVIVYGLGNYNNFPNIYSNVYKITITGISGNDIIATYTLVNSYTNQAPIIWANEDVWSSQSLIPNLMYTNLYKHISFNDMLYNPIKTNNVFLNAILQHTYIVDTIYPTLSTYQDKYLVFKRIGDITQSSSNLYIRDNIIFDKSLDPNGRPVFYYRTSFPGSQLVYDSVTNQVIVLYNWYRFNRLSYTDILNGVYNPTYITYINNAYALVGAHNGWFYYIEGYGDSSKLKRLNYTTLVREDIITGLGDYQSVKYIQIGSILYIWFPINYPTYRIHKIDMMSPSDTLYVDIPSNILPPFFDIPANNILDRKLRILEFDWINHTYTSRNILENTNIDWQLIMYLNDLGLYKIIKHDTYFEYYSAELTYGKQDSPYVDKSYFAYDNSITKMHLTSTKYRSTYSIYKLVYANDLSLDEPKTLETTIR
jgi:hypothetical protein